jgi:UDP-N-acetylglucosamine--N-acetylmuramyl-(pentapeptide) pyrophosphoryl-undecaprenol N-acetylglucosamine transferase
MRKILIAVGGSGGHLFPAEQLAESLKENKEIQIEVLFGGFGLSQNPLFNKEGKTISFREIESPSLHTKNPFSFLKSCFKGVFKSISLLRSYQPDIVVGFGSYHTFTLLLATVILRKKLILFEANCILGKVNRLFSFFAKKLAIQFPLYQPSLSNQLFLQKTRKNQVFISPFPWKKTGSLELTKKEALLRYGLDPEILTLLVFGGSQGASFFNEVMPQVFDLFSFPIQIIHLTGKTKVDYPKSAKVVVKTFESEMHLAYRAADVVICRSGAATLNELKLYQKRALLIPFPLASENHQKINAYFFFQKFQGVSILDQKEATPERIFEKLQELLKEKDPLPQQREKYPRFEDVILGVL